MKIEANNLDERYSCSAKFEVSEDATGAEVIYVTAKAMEFEGYSTDVIDYALAICLGIDPEKLNEIRAQYPDPKHRFDVETRTLDDSW